METDKKRDRITRKPNMVETMLFGCTLNQIPRLIPGLVMIAVLVLLVTLLTAFINTALGFKGLVSNILVVIIFGIILRNVLTIPAAFLPGINFSIKKLLRLGIILMGIRLSLFDVLKIGVWGIPIVVVCILTGLVVTTYFSRLFKIPPRLATLIAVGTGICGASAIVATAPGIGAKDEEVSYALANITVFGLIALAVYPFIFHRVFGGDTTMIGLFLGSSIHETAQVAASGLIYDGVFGTLMRPTVLEVATVTKLVRNVLMAIVIPVMTFVYRRRTGIEQDNESGFKKVTKLFPLFIFGFLLMALLRSIGDAGIRDSAAAFGLWNDGDWVAIHKGIMQWSGYLLAAAMAGIGLSTSFKTMRGLGIKPFYLGLFAAVMVGVAAFIMIAILSRFVTI